MDQITGFLPLIAMAVVFYLFIIRPQMKRQKQEKKFAEGLKRGDRVITKSGLHGKIFEIHGDGSCTLETGAGKLRYESSAISHEMSKKLNEPATKKEIKK